MARGTFIVKYNARTKERTVIMTDSGENKIFPFNENTVISSIHKYENLLIFHDKNRNAPFKINMDKVSETNPYYETTENAMLIKAQPDMPLVSVGYDSSYSAPSFNNSPYWFATRYKYEDGEVSAISPYSRPQVTVQISDDFDLEQLAIENVYNTKRRVEIGELSLFSDNPLALSSINIDYDNSETDTSIAQAYFNKKVYVTTKLRLFSYSPSENKEPKLVTTTSELGVHTFIAIGVDAIDGTKILLASKDSSLIIYKYKTDHWEKVADFISSTGYREFTFGRVVMSSYGNIVFAAGSYEVYRSKNGGENSTWEKVFNIRSKYPTSSKINDFCCSSDGRMVFVTSDAIVDGKSNTIIHRSQDFGNTFDLVYINKGGQDAISCSADGRVVCSGNKVSIDYGESWRIKGGVINGARKGLCAVSYTGKFIVTGISGTNDENISSNCILLSEDYGDTGKFIFNNSNENIVLHSFKITFPTHPSPDSSVFFINDKSNYADIEYNTGSKHVSEIEILMRKGSSVCVITTINKKQEQLGNNVEAVYRFLNTELYRMVATKDVVKMFDNVPLSAVTSTIIQNALMFGNYTEGYDTSRIYTQLTVDILKQEFNEGDVSLKTGTKQRYGIVYYDYFGRCTPVLNPVDVYVDNIRKEEGKERRVALIQIKYEAPSWAVKYKIARGTPNISFDMIKGFNNAYATRDKIYLEITGYPWITPKPGDYIELLSEVNSKNDSKPIIIPVFDFLDNSGDSVTTITLSDGSHTASSKTESNSPVPPGRYIVIDPPEFISYKYEDVIKDKSKYMSSNFYIIYEDSTLSNVLFNEIPYEFKVENRLHKGNQKDQESYMDYAECLLELDGDVILMKNPTRELNRYPSKNVFTTLGRTVGKVENYRRIHRFAGLCVSEPYVEDTKYNGLSSFNTALVNYKDLEKNHREIELIDGFDTNVEVYQRDKVSVVQYRKNVLATASGEKMVAQSQDIFGEQQMYAADYGMDNFRSYAKSGTSRYFVDGSRGAVLRKDLNGIVPVSRYGMEGWLFDELTKNGCVAGVYDARHNSYVLCLKNEAVNFLETNNGWSSFFSFVPDAICNTNSGVFSFKDGVLYRHDVKGSGTIYGKEQEVVVRFICNDFPDVIKVFNAVMVESSVVPLRVLLISDAGESEIDSGMFERKEGLYLAYIPMCGGEEGAEYVMAGVCGSNYSGSSIPLLNQGFTAIHKGDAVYKMVQGSEELIRTGSVVNIGGGYIEVDSNVELHAGDYVICADLSQINGSMHRGRCMEVEMHFSLSSGLLIKSVQTDIDESKI